MSVPPLWLSDGRTTLPYTYEEMVRYHGFLNIGGVALAYRLVAGALGRLFPPGTAPFREGLQVLTPLEPVHTGLWDGLEFLTRVRSRGALQLDLTPVDRYPGAAAPVPPGRFWFDVRWGEARVVVSFREGLFSQPFCDLVLLCRSLQATDADRRRLQEMKDDLARTVLEVPESQLLEFLEPF